MIEHINREIKVFKIMAERYKNRRRRHKLRMTLICAIRNYEIIHRLVREQGYSVNPVDGHDVFSKLSA